MRAVSFTWQTLETTVSPGNLDPKNLGSRFWKIPRDPFGAVESESSQDHQSREFYRFRSACFGKRAAARSFRITGPARGPLPPGATTA